MRPSFRLNYLVKCDTYPFTISKVIDGLSIRNIYYASIRITKSDYVDIYDLSSVTGISSVYMRTIWSPY